MSMYTEICIDHTLYASTDDWLRAMKRGARTADDLAASRVTASANRHWQEQYKRYRDSGAGTVAAADAANLSTDNYLDRMRMK